MKKSLLWTIILLITVSMMFTFSLAGCKDAAEETTEEVVEETTSAEEEIVEEETTEVEDTEITELPEITDQPVTVNIWSGAGAITEWYIKLAELYMEEHPNVTINVTAQDWGLLNELVSSALGSGEENMDLTWFWGGGRVDQFGRDGLLLDLSPYFDLYGWDSQQYPACQDYVTPGSGTYFISTDWVATPFMFYNKEIFEDAGVETPNTLEEIFTMADGLRDAGYENIWALGGKTKGSISHLVNQLLPRFMSKEEVNNLIFWERDPNKSAETAEVIKSQGAIDAYEFLLRMKEEGIFVEGSSVMDRGEATTMFTDGDAAIFSDGTWAVNTIRQQAPDMDLDYFTMPPNNGNSQLVATFCNGLVVPAYVSEDEEKLAVIMDFLNSLISNEYAIIAAEYGSITSNLTVSPEELEGVADPMILSIMADIAKNGSIDVVDIWTSPSRTQVYYDTKSAVFEGIITAEEAVQLEYEAAVEYLTGLE